MEQLFSYLGDLLSLTLTEVAKSLGHNWKVLTFSILLAVGLKTYLNTEKFSAILFRKKKVSIFASVAFGAFTPLCACGTTAVLIGMLTTTLPWGPIMAFLTSSPLMSPDGFVMITGVIGLRFAIALTIASVVIGISSGFITNIIEKHTHFLDNQSRFVDKEKSAGCACNKPKVVTSCACTTPSVSTSCACNSIENNNTENNNTDSNNTESNYTDDKYVENNKVESNIVFVETGDQLCCQEVKKAENPLVNMVKKLKLGKFLHGLYNLGLKQILLFYSIFIGVGFLINHFIPTSIISVLFGANAFYAVPLASLIGLPLYITTGSGIPIVQSMLESGASEGAMLAFMITGSATSAWVIAGLSTFMKKRAITLYVVFVLVGGIISGYILDLFTSL